MVIPGPASAYGASSDLVLQVRLLVLVGLQGLLQLGQLVLDLLEGSLLLLKALHGDTQLPLGLGQLLLLRGHHFGYTGKRKRIQTRSFASHYGRIWRWCFGNYFTFGG